MSSMWDISMLRGRSGHVSDKGGGLLLIAGRKCDWPGFRYRYRLSHIWLHFQQHVRQSGVSCWSSQTLNATMTNDIAHGVLVDFLHSIPCIFNRPLKTPNCRSPVPNVLPRAFPTSMSPTCHPATELSRLLKTALLGRPKATTTTCLSRTSVPTTHRARTQ